MEAPHTVPAVTLSSKKVKVLSAHAKFVKYYHEFRAGKNDGRRLRTFQRTERHLDTRSFAARAKARKWKNAVNEQAGPKSTTASGGGEVPVSNAETSFETESSVHPAETTPSSTTPEAPSPGAGVDTSQMEAPHTVPAVTLSSKDAEVLSAHAEIIKYLQEFRAGKNDGRRLHMFQRKERHLDTGSFAARAKARKRKNASPEK